MNESVKSIADWHAKTFPDATLAGQNDKFIAEMREWEASGNGDVLELADMFIVAAGMSRFSTMAAIKSGQAGLKEYIRGAKNG